MPIYMDRHYMEGATKNTVELAHEQDMIIQGKYGIDIKTYWFDEERHTAFCLIEAPDKESVVHMHGESHGSIPHEIIEVDPQVVQSFLGGITTPLPADNPRHIHTHEVESAFRTIMFTDLTGSTATTTRLGDKQAMHLLRIHNAMTRNELRRYKGREVKHTGDGFMVAFVSAVDAINCAIAIQQSFAAYNAEETEEQLHVRIGMSAGEPVHEDGDIFGSTVQLAARLCDIAETDGIVIGSVVREQCMNADFDLEALDDLTPKGFDKALKIYSVKY